MQKGDCRTHTHSFRKLRAIFTCTYSRVAKLYLLDSECTSGILEQKEKYEGCLQSVLVANLAEMLLSFSLSVWTIKWPEGKVLVINTVKNLLSRISPWAYSVLLLPLLLF